MGGDGGGRSKTLKGETEKKEMNRGCNEDKPKDIKRGGRKKMARLKGVEEIEREREKNRGKASNVKRRE